MRLAMYSFLIGALAIAVPTTPALAEVQTNADAMVQIDIPAGYTSSTQNGMLVAKSADDAVGIIFWVVDKSNAKDAIALLDKGLAGQVTDTKWGKPKKTKINGLKGLKNVGTATVAGKPAITMLAILGPTPTEKGLIVFGAIDQSKVAEHKAELAAMFASLKPSK